MSPSKAVHIWSRCHYCGMNPILGPCFRCETCPLGPDIDLCSSCYEGYLAGRVVHPDPDAVSAAPGPHHFARSEGTAAELYAPWLNIPCPQVPPPLVPPGFLVRPEFRSGRESVFGGYGFIVQFGAQALLLTALHVMDELIKSKRIDTTARNLHYTGEELPAHVSSVHLYDVTQDRWMLHELGDASPMLVLPNARTADEEPFAWRDIAAFRVKSRVTVSGGSSGATSAGVPGALSAVPLANEEPEPGDPIWLAAAMPDRTRTRRAVCVEKTARSFIFRYDEAKELPKHSSGAPILDRHGAVVGINTGLGKLGGREVGHANPLSSIRTHLERARL